MKKLIGKDTGLYTFDSANRKITFFNCSFSQEQILTITNVMDGKLIYVFADETLTGTLNGNILTLAYNTTTMSDTDLLQIYVDIPDVTPIQNKTETNIYLDGTISDSIPIFSEQTDRIFGSQPLTDKDGLKVKTVFKDTVESGAVGVAQQARGIDCAGCPTVLVQVAGTWAGTLTFEGRANSGDYQTIAGAISNTLTGSLVTTTTANGIFRFNTAGLQRFQVRFSAFTSGTATITLVASAETSIQPTPSPMSGSQSQLLSQRASTYESITYDSNLAVVLGVAALFRNGFTAVDPVVAPTVNPTQPTTYADNRFSKYPQIFPRLRVESGGDQKLPFAQEQNTNRILVATPELYSLLEQILLQLKMSNQMTMDNHNIPYPNGWEEIK